MLDLATTIADHYARLVGCVRPVQRGPVLPKDGDRPGSVGGHCAPSLSRLRRTRSSSRCLSGCTDPERRITTLPSHSGGRRISDSPPTSMRPPLVSTCWMPSHSSGIGESHPASEPDSARIRRQMSSFPSSSCSSNAACTCLPCAVRVLGIGQQHQATPHIHSRAGRGSPTGTLALPPPAIVAVGPLRLVIVTVIGSPLLLAFLSCAAVCEEWCPPCVLRHQERQRTPRERIPRRWPAFPRARLERARQALQLVGEPPSGVRLQPSRFQVAVGRPLGTSHQVVEGSDRARFRDPRAARRRRMASPCRRHGTPRCGACSR